MRLQFERLSPTCRTRGVQNFCDNCYQIWAVLNFVMPSFVDMAHLSVKDVELCKAPE